MENKVRRHQSHLPREQTLPYDVCSLIEKEDGDRGGPKQLAELQLHVLSKNKDFVVLNKGPDERMDGAFDVTLEKALTRDFPHVNKFRWIHQLDFATSGVLVVGSNKEAAATGCRLFREKKVQKEYLAVVRGHLPFHSAKSADSANASAKYCTISNLELLIQDMEELERMRIQQRGSRAHQKMPGYPRGVRHGQNLFEMEQAQLLREIRGNNGGKDLCTKAEAFALSPAQSAFTKMTWRDLTKEEKDAYTEKAKVDKQRFLKELSEFLRQEKNRLAQRRKYEICDREESDEASEPVAYIFDVPIVEPHRSTGVFRMLVGSETDAVAKQSTTICFVLGHAMYNGECVTKVLLRPLNGRRHQLRIHLAHHGYPIVGDVTYGSKEDRAPRMMLHAWRIWLCGRPADQKKYGNLYFESPDPFDFLVPSEHQICTITYHNHKKAQNATAEVSKKM